MSSTAHPDDELIIKTILQVTLDPKEKSREFTFLNKLHDKLVSVQTAATSFGTPPGNTQNSLHSVLQSALTSLLPSSELDLIPCENCSKLIPMNELLDHENLCGIVPASSMPVPPLSHTVPQSLIPTNPTQAPSPPPKIDRNLLSAALQEKLLTFAGNGNAGIRNGGRYLIDCYQRVNGAIKAEKTAPSGEHILLLVKNDILKHCKELLLLESTKNRGSPTGKELLTFIDGISPEFMNDLLSKCSDSEATTIFTSIFQELGLQMRLACRGKNLRGKPQLEFLNKISALANDARLFKVIGAMVAKEAMSASSSTARELENLSVLGAFLVPTIILSPYDNTQFTHFQKNISTYPTCDPKMVQDLQSELRAVVRQDIDAVHGLLKKLFSDKDTKESALNWVAAFMQLNDARASINPVDPMSYEITLVLSTDGFMINMLYLLLIFCQPFIDPNNPKLNLIVNSFPLLSHRYDFSKQPKLAQFVDVDLSIPSNPPAITFVSEMFFATLYSIHVGLMSTVGHYTNTLQLYTQTRNQIEAMKNQMGESWRKTPQGEKLAMTELRIFEFLDSFGTQLLDPAFLKLLAQFSLLVMKWFLSFTPAPRADVSIDVKRLFMCFPEFFVKDIAEVLLFIIRSKADVILEQSDMLQKTIDWCVTLLNVPTLVKSPIIRSKLTTILTEIVYKKQAEEQRISKTGWGMISTQALQFATVFQENTLAQNNLAYGLMIIYVDVDIIEGLDVDKENFDKYSLRRNIAMLLNDLWQTVAFKQSFKKECKSNHFSKFINTVLNDSIHLLEDSLGRLVDIRQLQLAMADKDEWDKQDPEIKRERQRYYEIQENSARGFLTLANSILDILFQLTRESDIVPVFMEAHTVGRVGAMLNHFFISLCGPKCNTLKVKNPEKYSFSPKDLLQKILRITLSFTEFPIFIDSMSRDLDYSADVMKQAYNILVNNNIVPKSESQKFLEFITKVNSNIETIAASTAGNNKEGGKQESSELMELDQEELEKLYVTQLQDKRFDSCDMKGEDGEKYNHHYASNIQASNITALAGSRMQRIVKECTMLSTSLPVALASSIFVRADEERMDVLKAIITGPKDSPYSIGCFEFHIFLPPTYPTDAPLCNLETTGNGTVRFNPNLYNCGKVCLSLLGTWHGDQNSKWNPSTSTIHQVLVSIEALIMVEHPYFNEPAYEAQRGTKEGDLRSREYNEVIRLGTLRHAILGQIKNPSPGFEDVIKTHFRLQKDRLLKQCQQWLAEASPENAPKFERSIEDLKRELANL